MELTKRAPAELEGLAALAEVLDNRYRIPGTNIRFGIDAIIGLIPYIGDVLTFIISVYLLFWMVRKGASGMLVIKMLGNILFDGVMGTLPILGDLLDFRIRANARNVDLMLEHYEEGQHQGSAWPVVIMLLILVILLIALSAYVVWRVLYWVFS
ncbi:MAG TPA: DUF4112 domain-containing protein [Saprospiraceae bacterium]|nr:DUF4112 domain-containing protein [Saprospiraceae bacterium]